MTERWVRLPAFPPPSFKVTTTFLSCVHSNSLQKQIQPTIVNGVLPSIFAAMENTSLKSADRTLFQHGLTQRKKQNTHHYALQSISMQPLPISAISKLSFEFNRINTRNAQQPMNWIQKNLASIVVAESPRCAIHAFGKTRRTK
jgi:hypothetical protein